MTSSIQPLITFFAMHNIYNRESTHFNSVFYIHFEYQI